MGKKHKKHHKSEKKSHDDEEYERSTKEPLKLVLKVTNPDADEVYSHGSHEERRHKHKKKKKKKSSEKEKHKHHSEDKPSKHQHVETEEEMESVPDEEEPPAKRLALDPEELENEKVEDIDVKEAHPLLLRQADEPTILKGCLKYIQSILQRKDINGFFAYPVNDVIAPGYSSIIQHPMDFSTMLAKIEAEEYHSVMDYKKDFELMCNNAMTYNRPETIYYKEAKKLLYSGRKQMSKEKLMTMKRNLGFMGSITSEELGMNEPESEVSVVTDAIIEKEKEQKKKAKANLSKFEAIPDNMTPEEILAQAQAAAREAAESLTLRKPQTNYAFLRRREDGSTSLTVMNPENDGIVSETEKIMNIGNVVGRLNSGTWSINGFKEDKRNKVSPVNYLNYGPFSSYAPQCDSSFANITKEESDLLLTTYGDETGVQYAKSVKSFVENSGDYVIKMVDKMLDILTKGEHSKTQSIIEERRREEEQKMLAVEAEKENLHTVTGNQATDEGNSRKTGQSDIDVSALRSLGDLGVDVSFLDQYDKNAAKDKVQEKLDHTASLIQDLQQTQSERLSARPPPYLCDVPGPSEKEMQLAQKVTEELKDLAKEATPRGISSLKGIRAAMGISLGPTESNSSLDASLDNRANSEMSGSVDSPAAQTSEPISAMDIDQEFQEFFQQNTTDMSDKDTEDTLAANMC